MSKLNRCQKAIRRAKKQYKYLGEGSYRITFDMCDGNVLKLPHTAADEYENIREYNRWKNRNDEYLAECELIDYYGVAAIVMEKVKVIKDAWSKNLPSWINNIDTRQVGYTVYGELVAYDYNV